jgi:hypothetical protein
MVPNANASCAAGKCSVTCIGAFADCNGKAADGCEWNTLQDGPCLCTPGMMQACYDGAPGTQNVGPCKGGMQTCDASGSSWGPCVGEVLPKAELCGNAIDDNCNGKTDEGLDLDGDGWKTCDGDCCDAPGACGATPKLINPGAFEVPNNGVDDDCDPSTPDAEAAPCSSAQKFAGVSATDIAKAIELCQFTSANPPLIQKKWGVITASQLYADGTPAGVDLTDSQTAVLVDYGTGGVVPKKNATMAGLSTGMMRDKDDPGYVIPITGTSFTSAIPFMPTPAAPLGTYTSAHGQALLGGKCGAMNCSALGTEADDSVDVRLVIRVPTNAQSFSYDFRFFSAEYQSYQCSDYNDYYLAMLSTKAAGIPADHNISFDALKNPVSVNNGFFQVCGGNLMNCGACPDGTAALVGTGMDDVNGGGTEWLTTDAPVVPGETMTIEFVIFDVQDHIYDSLVLLDNFRWNLQPAKVGTHM